MSKKRTSHERILRMTQLAVLSAIIIMMTFVPYIGLEGEAHALHTVFDIGEANPLLIGQPMKE